MGLLTTSPDSSEESRALVKYGIRLIGFNRRFYKNIETDGTQSNLRMIIISKPVPGTWTVRIFVRDDSEQLPGSDNGKLQSVAKSVFVNTSINGRQDAKPCTDSGDVEFEFTY